MNAFCVISFGKLLGKVAVLGVILCSCLCGCARREVDLRVTPHPASFSQSGERARTDHWWTEFGDQNLNRQVAVTVEGNFELDAALDRLLAARAVTRREASDFWPDVNLFTEYDGLVQTDGPNRALFLMGSDFSYQVDLWGQIEARVQAARLRAEATREDYQTIGILLAGEVAASWFALVEANAQFELLQQQTLTNSLGLKLQESRFALGLIRSPDVLRQRQLVDSTREQEVIAESQIRILEHRLAVLQGRPPQGAQYATGSNLPELPPLPETGLPCELVLRRPDVRRAYFALQAADRDLAAAITDQFPRLNLGGSLITATESAENLFRDWVLVLSSQLIGPLIDGGQRRAEVARNNAVTRQRLNEYQQVILNAFREVEDALVREQYQLERIELLNSQTAYARLASEQLSKQYATFDVDFLDLLSATTAEQRLQRETLSARLELIVNRIELYVALAGGFDTRSLHADQYCPPVDIYDE